MTLRFFHTFGHRAGEVLTLSKDVVRIGRAPDNEVAFDPEFDRDASAHHAEVRREPTGWVLVDLTSRNGTFIKGVRVGRHVLSPGDEIAFGPKGPRLRVEFARDEARLSAVPEKRAVSGTEFGEPLYVSGAPRDASSVATSLLTADATPVGPPRDSWSSHAPQAPPSSSAPGTRTRKERDDLARSAEQRGVVVAPIAGKRVGQRTIAQMIGSALSAVRRRPGTTKELSALVDRHVNNATARQRGTTRFLGALLVFALVCLGGLVVWSTQSRDEIDQLRTDLARLPPEDPRRKDIEGRLGSLHPANANFGRNLYDSSKKGIFMLAAGGDGFCTAFAVRPSVLATNAHCVLSAQRHRGSIVALENEGHGRISFAVRDMKAHPGFRENDPHALTPDVGIVMIAGKAAIVLEMATAQELMESGAGDEVYLIGFPGRLMEPQNPAATFLAAHVGRITTPAGRPGAFRDMWLVQHDAATTHGTSGSPVFNGKGKVIAVNSGGYMESDDATIAGRKTEVVRASPYKFGMRIDLLNAILR